eukprot:gnl/MRDRNA2_/MRDRNA2_78257_c0_seq1.p1 gnl/MRDRNA2_/MRDRNA2_78257_c0~~gnl/MRDRNA2_/MRDRNA2_78257_c0_seq1.p1  ORF type:complete len:104 (+),score=15.86 gnl/MRDRNA2_/MRDRNA2_78257_c0_seq1:77-388(+)
MRVALLFILVPSVFAELPWAEARRKLAKRVERASIDPSYGHKPTWVGIANEGRSLETAPTPQEKSTISGKELDGILKHLSNSISPESPQSYPALRKSPDAPAL